MIYNTNFKHVTISVIVKFGLLPSNDKVVDAFFPIYCDIFLLPWWTWVSGNNSPFTFPWLIVLKEWILNLIVKIQQKKLVSEFVLMFPFSMVYYFPSFEIYTDWDILLSSAFALPIHCCYDLLLLCSISTYIYSFISIPFVLICVICAFRLMLTKKRLYCVCSSLP